MESYRVNLTRYEAAYLSVMLETMLETSDQETLTVFVSVSGEGSILSVNGECLPSDREDRVS